MEFLPTSLPDVLLLQPEIHGDTRGFFLETYHADRFAGAGISGPFVQDNHSGSQGGVLRGLHYQIRQPQGKLVQAVAGEVYDVAVDLRRSSPTFGRCAETVLSAGSRMQLWIPPGFAHGFYVLSEWAEIIYKATDYYSPEWERCLLWNDPALGIRWPLIGDRPPVLSARDAEGKRLAQADLFD